MNLNGRVLQFPKGVFRLHEIIPTGTYLGPLTAHLVPPTVRTTSLEVKQLTNGESRLDDLSLFNKAWLHGLIPAFIRGRGDNSLIHDGMAERSAGKM